MCFPWNLETISLINPNHDSYGTKGYNARDETREQTDKHSTLLIGLQKP